MTKSHRFILILILIVSCVFHANAFAYDNVIYIWQRNWDGYLEDAISSIQDTTGYFTVLCGDLKFEGEKPTINLVDINWTYLTQTETSATLAFRINTHASKFFGTDVVYAIADSIKDAISTIAASAPQDEIVGIQFDYDCPTSKLEDYTRFLKIIDERLKPLKEKHSKFKISITALPTWLRGNDFRDLVKATDYYVLQLHSFELPKDAEQANKIFPNNKAKSYVEQASLLKHPYYISLPTYGYEVAFSKEGKFLGLRAESNPILWGKDISYNTEIANPNEILAFTRYLTSEKPQNFLGIYWFRLLLNSDEFNWNVKTLVALIEGRQPRLNIKTELINPKNGLCEVYIINDGEQNITSPVSFKLTWDNEDAFVYDVLDQYSGQRTEKGLQIKGPAPKAGNKALVAWFRDADNVEGDIPLEVGNVEICS